MKRKRMEKENKRKKKKRNSIESKEDWKRRWKKYTKYIWNPYIMAKICRTHIRSKIIIYTKGTLEQKEREETGASKNP